MFLGHLAQGLTAKRWAPRVSLGWFVGAAIAVDLLWPILVMLGVERLRIVPGALVFESYP